MFEDAGVEMPDDETWTWEDFKSISKEISDALGDGMYGVQDYGGNEAGFNIYARQHGESLYAEDGTLGYSDATLEAWWQDLIDLRESGAMPDGSRSVEIAEGGPEQSLLGTNSGAMGFWWTNQPSAISSAAGRDLVLLRPPGESEFDRTGLYFKPAMFYSVSETTEHPEEAAKARGLPPQRPRGRRAHALRPRPRRQHRCTRGRRRGTRPAGPAGRRVPRGHRGRDRGRSSRPAQRRRRRSRDHRAHQRAGAVRHPGCGRCRGPVHVRGQRGHRSVNVRRRPRVLWIPPGPAPTPPP
ncbi:ABC transporter substrate-binding protein [Demequina litorisediminis]|uniref:ABC transporter substrate-binding protein n=1 Tax=Demequina litorisediminis TaxID=1849022 RepID=UPI0032AF1065